MIEDHIEKGDKSMKGPFHDKINVGRDSLGYGRVEFISPNKIVKKHFDHLNLEV